MTRRVHRDQQEEVGAERPDLPLLGLHVLECGDTIASAYAGRILADLGADVVVVEHPSGHPLRRTGPFVPAPGDPRERSAAFACFAAGKRSVVVDSDSSDRDARLSRLLDGAAVMIRSAAGGTGLVSDSVVEHAVERDPGLVVLEISSFGSKGANSCGTSDLLSLAASGLLSVNSTEPGDPASTPLRYRGELSMVHAAASGVLAVLGAVAERRRTGRGQRIDISAQAVASSIMATAFPTYSYTGLVAAHDGRRGVEPWGFYRCADGVVLIQVTEDRQWHALGALLGDPEWARLDIFATTAQRIELADAIDIYLQPAIEAWTVEDFLAACHHHGVAASKIHSAADLLHWEHAVERAAYRPVLLGDGPGMTALAPVPGWRYRGTPTPTKQHAPALGSAGDGSRPVWDPVVAEEPVAAAADAWRAPLEGVKVVDLTWVWAGPHAAMQLAHLGADVVKVESSGRLDVTRQLGPWAAEVPGPNRSGYFNQYNLGKRSILLDLKHPEGVATLGAMLREADVVIDNMSVGALARLGFSYEELHRLNPRIVAVSMTGFGEWGPESERMAYGSLIDALSGVASSNGAPGGGPTDFVMSLPDPTAGVHTAIATVAAVLRARRTGIGERVEVSMLEASVAAFPWPILYQSVTGDGPPVEGNRDELRAPHDVYRCAGTYEWVAVTVESDAQWRALCSVIGRADLAADPSLADLVGRRARADAIDAAIGAWTIGLTPAEAAAALRRAGVPAEAVLHVDGAFADHRLVERGLFIRLPHPEVGDRPLCGPAWVVTGHPMCATTAAPCLGAHTRVVLREWLGHDDAEIDRLEAAGVLR